jgi:hypothetical protein
MDCHGRPIGRIHESAPHPEPAATHMLPPAAPFKATFDSRTDLADMVTTSAKQNSSPDHQQNPESFMAEGFRKFLEHARAREADRRWHLWQPHENRFESFSKELKARRRDNLRRRLAAVKQHDRMLCNECQRVFRGVTDDSSWKFLPVESARWCSGCFLLVRALSAFFETDEFFSEYIFLLRDRLSQITVSLCDRTILLTAVEGSSCQFQEFLLY